jgi:hypothetical protein
MRPKSVRAKRRRRGHRVVHRNPLLVTFSSEKAHAGLAPNEAWPETPWVDAIELLARTHQPESMIEAIELLVRMGRGGLEPPTDGL